MRTRDFQRGTGVVVVWLGVAYERNPRVTPIPTMIARFKSFESLDTPPDPKSENHGLDYHVTAANYKVIKTLGIII